MSLGLVARSARSLSEHLNRYYRTLKGIDADSLAVRLPTGGSFEVRHSATASPVLLVTDAGIDGSDITPNSITSDKLAGGIPVPANSITTNEIQNGTIQQADIAPGALSAAFIVAGPSSLVNQTTTGLPYDVGTVQLTMTGLTAGSVVLYQFSISASHTVFNGRASFWLARGDTSAALTPVTHPVPGPDANLNLRHVDSGYFVAPVSGSLVIKLRAQMTDAGTLSIPPNCGVLSCIELRR